MTDQELIKQWDEYIESMGSVMGAVEHMAQQMRDRIELLVKELDISRMASVVMDNTVEELESKLALMIFERDEVMMFERDEAWKRAAYSEKMWGEAEVKLAKAVEVLRPFAKTPETWGLRHVEFTFEELRPARTLLAKLGEK